MMSITQAQMVQENSCMCVERENAITSVLHQLVNLRNGSKRVLQLFCNF